MAKKSKAPAVQAPVTVHQTKMLMTEVLLQDPENTNKQSKHTHEELKQNIKDHGFDEALLVRPTGDGYFVVVSGNHRYAAGKALGMTEFPCVVRDDWTAIEAKLQGVRRNYSRGQIDKDAFTAQVNKLVVEEGLPLHDIMTGMGFEDSDAFSEYFKTQKVRDANAAQQVQASASNVKMLDDMGRVLSELFAEHGDTVPQSFIIFPAGGKNHMYIACTPTLKRTLEGIAQQCVLNNLDINVALGGLLTIGIGNSNFLDESADRDYVKKSGEPLEDDDIELMK